LLAIHSGICYASIMKTYDHVEDYLEIMAGKRDVNSTNNYIGWVLAARPLISLARYDVAFLDSVTDSTILGTALTDRQAELAVKLLVKYQRQLASKGVHVDPDRLPKFRLPLRKVDRSRRAWIQDNVVQVQFPYDTALIADFKELAKTSQGRVFYKPESRLWHMDITEYNVNWVVAWGRARGIEIAPELCSMQDMVLAAESAPYGIELARTAAGLEIVNAESSLIGYLEQQGITVTEENLLLLADWSSVLGYSVSDQIWDELAAQVPYDLMPLVQQRIYQLSGDASQLARIERYAQLVNREPVVIFDPSPGSLSYAHYEKYWNGEVIRLANQKLDLQQYRAVYSDRTLPAVDNIPLLISHVGLVAGTQRTMMVQSSQKIVYFNQKL